MKIAGQRIRGTRLVHTDSYVIAVEVDMVVPAGDSEPCLAPESIAFLAEVKDRAERGDVAWLRQHGKIYMALGGQTTSQHQNGSSIPAKKLNFGPLTPAEEREIYDRHRREFTAADLQKYTELDEGIPMEQVIAELEADQEEYDRKKAQ